MIPRAKETMTVTTSEEEIGARLAQLENQQALLTRALPAALEGRWTGAGSVVGYLYAISPHMQGQVNANPPAYPAEERAEASVDEPPGARPA
jgi:hypothetical protein